MKFYFLIFMMAGCASNSLKKNNTPTQELLFVDGVYDQIVHVKINVPEKNINESFDFKSALKKKSDEIVLLAYNGFGFIMFRLEDKPPHLIKWTSDVEILNKNKDFFLKIYPQVKNMLKLKGSQLSLIESKYEWVDAETRIQFFTFDSLGRPLQLQISDDKSYWVNIKNLYKNI